MLLLTYLEMLLLNKISNNNNLLNSRMIKAMTYLISFEEILCC